MPDLQIFLSILEKYGWLGFTIMAIVGIILKTDWTLVIRYRNKT